MEKDFWVCWTLDVLFNGLQPGSPRLLFKGGTSLSKAFGLIARFSEDIDITVFRDDLGFNTDTAALETMSGKKRRAQLDAIRASCHAHINGALLEQFSKVAAAAIPSQRFRLQADPNDADGQSLLFWYPAVTAARGTTSGPQSRSRPVRALPSTPTQRSSCGPMWRMTFLILI